MVPGNGGFYVLRRTILEEIVEDARDVDQMPQQHRYGLISNLRTRQFSLANRLMMLRYGSNRWTTTCSYQEG